jgi:hypothetical protein
MEKFCDNENWSKHIISSKPQYQPEIKYEAPNKLRLLEEKVAEEEEIKREQQIALMTAGICGIYNI